MMQLWIGIITFAAGMTLIASSKRDASVAPRWLPRLAYAVTALGLGTLAATRPGVAWNAASIALSLVAIVLLIGVIRDSLRR